MQERIKYTRELAEDDVFDEVGGSIARQRSPIPCITPKKLKSEQSEIERYLPRK